ncbi:MAG: bifunctional adenosylcobinamide kinase/adenosylcobinamide-phosphate guanylyltransferase [Bacillaceae bacterium]|nr:bifunctional adenosylcobinamide kinase/adenosylcobinamide-phosphate guanylyltransferase [Bacillaceae bacterium]
MEFITGGAFHGKRNWVYSNYKIDHVDEFVCYNGYEKDVTIQELYDLPNRQLCVITGMEMIFKRLLQEGKGRKDFNELLNRWMEWEQLRTDRKLVLVGCDIGKGIVPIAKEDRQWRDLAGWSYQDIVQQSNKVYRIWYGISERLK